MDWTTILTALIAALIGGGIGAWANFGVEIARENRNARQNRKDVEAAIDALSPQAFAFLKRFVVEGNPLSFKCIPSQEWGLFICTMEKEKILSVVHSHPVVVNVSITHDALAVMRRKYPIVNPKTGKTAERA